MLTLNLLEGYLQKHETSRLNDLIIQNQQALYEGRYSIKEEINRNIERYLSESLKFKLGVRTSILVKTKDDRVLYPSGFDKDFSEGPLESDFLGSHSGSLDYMEVATENYRIMNEGLILSVNVQIRHNSWLSNSILVFFVFISVLIIQAFVRKGIREAETEEKKQKEITRRLSEQLSQAESTLQQVGIKEEEYLKKIAQLNKDKSDLSKDIDGLLEEMEGLEAGLEAQRRIKEETEIEVLKLMEELDQQKDRLEKPKKKKKKVQAAAKRFNVLYKNLVFTDRAVEGFLSMNDEFKLKAEEVIHKLNEDDAQVPVKRKVFGKGGKMNVLEILFSYSGRIYFQKDHQSKSKILTIGTKNTQQRDLAYIESIK